MCSRSCPGDVDCGSAATRSNRRPQPCATLDAGRGSACCSAWVRDCGVLCEGPRAQLQRRQGRKRSSPRGADGEARKQALQLCQRVRSSSRMSRRIIILAQLYARCDQAALARLRTNLFPWTWVPSVLPQQLTAPSALLLASAVFAVPVLLGAAEGAAQPRVQSSSIQPAAAASPGLRARLHGAVAGLVAQPTTLAAGVASAVAVSGGVYCRYRHSRSQRRAAELRKLVRVVKRRPVEQLAGVLDMFVSTKDSVDTIRCVRPRIVLVLVCALSMGSAAALQFPSRVVRPRV